MPRRRPSSCGYRPLDLRQPLPSNRPCAANRARPHVKTRANGFRTRLIPQNRSRDVLTFKTFVLWLHLTAVVIWLGGMFFMTLVLVPMLRRSTFSQREFSEVIERTVKRFQTISSEAVGIILLTGIFNLINAGLGEFSFSSAYLQTVATKLLLLVVIIGIQSIQSYRILPKLISAPSSDDKLPAGSNSFDRLRKTTILLSTLNLVLAGCVIYLGLGLKYL